MPDTRSTAQGQAESSSITMENLLQLIQSLQSTNNSGGNLHFENFDENEEKFISYKQRLENFSQLKNVAADKKSMVLINYIGAKHYQLLANLCSPRIPSDKSYEELVKLLEQHLCPEPNEISEQHRFGLLKQKDNQSISEFVTELKKGASSCNFLCETCRGSTLNTYLRFQLIIGLLDSNIRERLLMEKK